MTGWFAIYSLLAAVAVGVLLAARVVGGLCMRRRHHRDAALRGEYLHILMMALMTGDEQPPHFPLLASAGARMLLAETVAGVVDVTYGLDTEVLRRIVTHYKIDRYLLRRVRFTSGYRRARCLALIGRLPMTATTADRLTRYSRSASRHVRFQTLMAQLSIAPETALDRIADFGAPLTACEVAEMMALLRRGMLPVAYEPLVASPNRNLRTIGLAIVRQFGIEQAETQLLHVVANDLPELSREALYILCSMHCEVVRREVTTPLAAMSVADRKALLRYMVFEGYSSRVLRRLFAPQELPYSETLVQSFKRCLA
ncbi:MAG: hypothetical protein RR270_02100 [Alistipes sp.]